MEMFIIEPSLIALYELYEDKKLKIGEVLDIKLNDIEHKAVVTFPLRNMADMIKQQFELQAAAMEASLKLGES